jgi:hypothetical protein
MRQRLRPGAAWTDVGPPGHLSVRSVGPAASQQRWSTASPASEWKTLYLGATSVPPALLHLRPLNSWVLGADSCTKCDASHKAYDCVSSWRKFNFRQQERIRVVETVTQRTACACVFTTLGQHGTSVCLPSPRVFFFLWLGGTPSCCPVHADAGLCQHTTATEHACTGGSARARGTKNSSADCMRFGHPKCS